jgi:hypothetical protein
MFLAMPMTPEVRQKWTEAWEEARKAKDNRRKENREKWVQRRDWSDDNQHKTDADAEDSSGEASGSLAQMRAIMLDVSTPLWRQRKYARESRLAILSHVPNHGEGAAKARDFSRAAPLSTGETDWPLEQAGFELLVPSQEGKGSPAALIEIVSRPAWPTAKKDGGTASRIRLAPAVNQANFVRGLLASAEDWEHLEAATRSG